MSEELLTDKQTRRIEAAMHAAALRVMTEEKIKMELVGKESAEDMQKFHVRFHFRKKS